MKMKWRNMVVLALLVTMLCGATSALAQVTFSAGVFDLPATLESSDEMSVEGAANYDARWSFLLD